MVRNEPTDYEIQVKEEKEKLEQLMQLIDRRKDFAKEVKEKYIPKPSRAMRRQRLENI